MCEINNTQVDNPKDNDVVMPSYSSIEYRDNCSQKSETLWLYCSDQPALANNSNIVDFTDDNATDSFKFKLKVIGKTGDDDALNVRIIVTLK